MPNLEELEAAQARYQQFEKDLAAGRQVEGLIAAIGTVTADSPLPPCSGRRRPTTP